MSDEPIGSAAEEAARLFRTLSDRLAQDSHDPDSACCACPVCRLIDVARDTDPEQVTTWLTNLSTSMTGVLNSFLADQRSQPSDSSEPDAESVPDMMEIPIQVDPEDDR